MNEVHWRRCPRRVQAREELPPLPHIWRRSETPPRSECFKLYVQRDALARTLSSIALPDDKTIEHSLLVEEVKWYKPEVFYPVRIGDVFESRYQVVGKLGYGAYTTVRHCRDLV